jgi:hypothetical protein
VILRSKRELEVTREKLRGLEELYAATERSPEENYAKELTLRSLRQTINQLKEEIVRFETRSSSAVGDN